MAELLPAIAQTFIGGQDASKIPDVISDGYYYQGINVSCRRAALQPRWGFDRKRLQYPTGGVTDTLHRTRSHKDIFEQGKFQLLANYTVFGKPYLITVIGGSIYFINQNTYKVTYVEIADKSRLNGRAPRLNFSAAGKYLVIYDFPAYPVIIEAFTARRADPAKFEVPAAVMGSFNQNRLFIINNGNEWTGGDPAGNTATPEAPITFTEVEQSGASYMGQIFQLPTFDSNDTITAVNFLQMADTSTGIGPFLIATDKAIYSFRTDLPRANWTQGQFGSVFTYNTGIAGPRAVVNINSDMFFISTDGQVRTLNMSRQDQQRYTKIPISREVENFTKLNDPSLVKYAFCGYFQNKAFFSVNPYRTQATDFTTNQPISDYAHGGFVVLEMDTMTSFGEGAKPAWAGLWTGIHPMDMLTTNNNRCFVMSKDDGINELWEINPNTTYDTDGCAIRYVKSTIRFKEHDFQDPFMNKEVQSLDMNFDNLQGPFNIDIKYKPSHLPYFIDWRKYTHEAPWNSCEFPCEVNINGYESHHIRDFIVGTPSDNSACSLVTQDFARVFRKIQLQITFSAKYWELHEYKINAVMRPKRETESLCETYPPVKLPVTCDDDWVVGGFYGCQ